MSSNRPGLRARLAMSLSEDQVVAWKRAAMAPLRAAAGARPARSGVSLEVKPGFLLVCALAALPLAGGRAGVAALALLGAVLLSEVPALLLASRGGLATLTLEASGPRVRGESPRHPASVLLTAALGSVLSLLVAALLHRLAARAGLESRAYNLAKVVATILVAWPACQLLPIAPFRAGSLMAQYLPPPIRFVWCTLSIAVVVPGGALLVALTKLPSLMVVVAASAAFALVTWREMANQLRDENNGAARLAHEAEQGVQRGAPVDAIRLARTGLGLARSAQLRGRLCLVLAWGAIGDGDIFLAHAALQQLSPEAMSVHLLAAYLRACGRLSEADELLLKARKLGQRTRETTKLLIELKAARGEQQAAEALAEEDAALLSSEDQRALRDAGCRVASAS
ncbi:MAG TPA: hypothetical protein VHB79_22130 [Polyangiaceae bacterium]|nr:hypothetical protein [Polyangiaceae bacterium]